MGGEADVLEHVQAAVAARNALHADRRRVAGAADVRVGRLHQARHAFGSAAHPRQQAHERRPEALRHQHDHHDKDEADDELPDERKLAAEIGAGEVDQHGGDCRAKQRAAAAQGDPDHEFGAELEVAEIGGDHVVVGGISEASQRGDDGRARQQCRLHARRADPAVATALLVLADCYQQSAEIAADEDPAEQPSRRPGRRRRSGTRRALKCRRCRSRTGRCSIPSSCRRNRSAARRSRIGPA